jgi:hypothetical protein
VDDAREGLILLDTAGDSDDGFEASFLEKIGHPVVVCHGPAVAETCPLLDGRGCEKFEEAHGIVFELDLEREQHRDIVARYRQLAADGMPIRIVVEPAQAECYADLLKDFEVWTRQMSVADLDGLAAEVEAADRFAESALVGLDIPEIWVG